MSRKTKDETYFLQWSGTQHRSFNGDNTEMEMSWNITENNFSIENCKYCAILVTSWILVFVMWGELEGKAPVGKVDSTEFKANK